MRVIGAVDVCWATMVLSRWSRRSLSVRLAPALLLACLPVQPGGSPPVAAQPVAAQPVAAQPGVTAPVVAAPVNPPEPPAVASPASTAAPTEAQTYLACGCGCCGGGPDDGEMRPVKRCLDRKQGETLEKIKAADEEARKNPQCAMMGCSLGTEYSYCD